MKVAYAEIGSNPVAKKKVFLLGTDRFGRDVLSRLMIGARITLMVGFIAVIISLSLGIVLGALAGYFRGWLDNLISWLMNVVWSIPTLLLVLTITISLGKGLLPVFVAVGLTMWVDVARIVRGEIFSIREKEFVVAGKALGFRTPRIIFLHILPNVMASVLVIASSNFASAILIESGLSFLGLGAQPPTPTWGNMIESHRNFIITEHAHLALIPGFAIMLMVLAFTMVSNGLKNALEKR
jgi:peptide/nickel transport system permease protein